MSRRDPGPRLHVALDYASNWEIRGGVWRYGMELAKALVRLLPPGSVTLPCYDLLPAERLDELRSTGARVRNGTARFYDRLDAMSRRRGRYVPWDRVLPRIYGPRLRNRLFQSGLGGADVYHAIFTCRGRARRGATVGTIHDLIPLLFPEEAGFGADRLRRMIDDHRRWAELVIVPSEATKADLVRHLDFPGERLRVIHHGIDTALFHPAAPVDDALLSRHGLHAGRFFLYVGALERRKNLERLIEAYHRAVPDRGAFPLVLTGARVHELPRLADALRDPASGVRHLGYVPDAALPGLYRAAHALVHVALAEGFGFTPLEAMACGTPVITAHGSATGEVVGEGGLLVDPTDAADIARAMQRLKDNRDMHCRLRQDGLARAAGFTWERTARKTYDVYEEASRRRREKGGRGT